MRLFLAELLAKVPRRLPAPLARHQGWMECRNSLIASHHLARARRAALTEGWQQCKDARDYYDFAARIFPSHQIRQEITGFLDFVRSEHPKIVMEIGTAEGGTNFLLGAALPEVKLKLGVDLFVQNTRLLEAFCRPGCRQIFLNGSSYAPEMVTRVRAALAGELLDVLFIDGDHTYAGVKADYEAYAPLVRRGGLIVFHDIVPDFQTRFGQNTGRWAGDVPKFWKDVRGSFAETWEFVEDPEQDGLGIGVGRVG